MTHFKSKQCLHVAPRQRFTVFDSWAGPPKVILETTTYPVSHQKRNYIKWSPFCVEEIFLWLSDLSRSPSRRSRSLHLEAAASEHTKHTVASCLSVAHLAFLTVVYWNQILLLSDFYPFCFCKTRLFFEAWKFANVFLITSKSNRTFPSSRPWINPFSPSLSNEPLFYLINISRGMFVQACYSGHE